MIPIDWHLRISRSTYEILDFVAYTSVSGFTIIVTGMVVARLFLVRRRHIKIMGECNPFQVHNGNGALSAEK